MFYENIAVCTPRNYRKLREVLLGVVSRESEMRGMNRVSLEYKPEFVTDKSTKTSSDVMVQRLLRNSPQQPTE
jgi:hypothetical protein